MTPSLSHNCCSPCHYITLSLSLSHMLEASIYSLPLDAVVQILCKLNHDELKPVINVSKFFHNAVCLARQWHFDFSTPAPKTWAFCGEMDGIPDGPLRKQSKKPRKIRLSEEETRGIAAVLFPVGDCKKGLVSGLTSRPEKMCHRRAIHVSHANA